MDIIFVCTKSITFNTFLTSQADYFKKKGLNIKVACSDIENLNHEKGLSHKINFPTKSTHLINIFKYLKIFNQIQELIKKNKSSIFYLHTPIAAYLFRLFSFFYNLKIIYFVHGFRFTSKTHFIKASFFKFVEKILSLNTKIFITINVEDYNYAKKKLFKKVPVYKVDGIGLDINKNHNLKFRLKNVLKKIIVIGVYKKSKGYNDILKIAELLDKKKFKIDCFGYGNNKKYQSIKNKKKLSNISFKKFDVNLRNKIKNYDLMLHLSKREGLPVSVMECLKEGVPVICYNIRGTKDLIKDQFNGFFVSNYKEVPNKILYLKLEKNFFNKVRFQALNSITKNYSKIEINKKIYKIIRANFKK